MRTRSAQAPAPLALTEAFCFSMSAMRCSSLPMASYRRSSSASRASLESVASARTGAVESAHNSAKPTAMDSASRIGGLLAAAAHAELEIDAGHLVGQHL